VTECHQTILQTALIIGTSISGWRVIWSGYARLATCVTSFPKGVKGSITVVMTPLISLMIDQKEKFLQRSLKVEFVGEAQTDESAIINVLNCDIQLVYISPKSLLFNRKYRSMLTTKSYQKLKALVVDEAHCIKFWLVCKNYF